MADILIDEFLGMVPRNPIWALGNNQAQWVQNARFPSGALDVLSDKTLVASPGISGAIQSLFKFVSNGVDYWMAFANDVDVVKSIVGNDTSQRIYYTGDGEPRVTNFSLATGGTPYPNAFFVLGVYPPATAPGLSGSGGVSATVVSRSACYTFVTPWGEESQPSPASAVVSMKTDDTINITGMDVAPLNTFTITGASWAGGIATVNMASTFGMRVGEYVNVAGMNPSGYNATKAVLTAVTGTTVSYACAANPGAFVAGGTMTRVAPHNTTGMFKRLYVTITSASGTYFYLAKDNIPVANTTTSVAGTFTPGSAILTTDWEMPPTDMIGLCEHPNGFNVGFRANEICFSEPGYPYAWPSKYRKGVAHPVVAVKAFGNSIFIGTSGKPYAMTGSDPASISREAIDQPWPCMSKRSMVKMPYGVQYAAPQGLVRFGPEGATLITDATYRQEDWKLLNPSTFYGAHYGQRYVASYLVNGVYTMLVIDPSDNNQVKTVGLSSPVLYGDETNGKLYLGVSGGVYEFDASSGLKLNYDWWSKEFVFPKPINLAACKIDVDFSMTAAEVAAAQASRNAVIAANAARTVASTTPGTTPSFVGNRTASARGRVNGFAVNKRAVNASGLAIVPPANWNTLTFILYVNGQPKFTKNVTSGKAFRLLGGYKADRFSVRLQGNMTVKRIIAGQSMDSLRTA